MKRMTAAAAVVASVLVVTGCSSSSDSGKKDDKKPGSGASRTPDAFGQDEAAMKAAAVKFREATVHQDWRQMCALETRQNRGGKSVDECAASNGESHPGSPSSVTVEGNPVTVPASGDYIAGSGLMVVTTSNGEEGRSVHRVALRMVKEDDKWLVEQDADVYDTDMRHGAPVRDALMRS
ncbi:hypothetical protein ACFY1P_24735 [Streptomyces sp. NPDC001407]|uniref:hypothetical protein n=1 Tax=unclassified Streptomyces TaxID=2593676 RepID=UPI0033E4C03F